MNENVQETAAAVTRTPHCTAPSGAAVLGGELEPIATSEHQGTRAAGCRVLRCASHQLTSPV